jgi:vitamin B12 transporter
VLQSFGLDEDETVTSLSPRPPSRIAENVSVITADDIARINAHTLADVLQTVPGIQLDYLRTPSTFTFFNIQGALNSTVLVLVDGIRQNDFYQNIAEPGLILVQQIERIEIIKGAASAAWGPALGGVINIVTKSSDPDRGLTGMLASSLGERTTTDSRLELSGTLDRLGYYLTAGKLYSRGLLPNNGTNLNNLYGKLSWLTPAKGTATAGFSYLHTRRGADEGYFTGVGVVHDDNENRRLNGFLKFSQPLAERLNLEMDAYATSRDDRTEQNDLIAGEVIPYQHSQLLELSRGLNTRLIWGDNRQNLATGFEYSHAESKMQSILPSAPPSTDRSWDRWAVYANGSVTFGSLTILPGIRYDNAVISREYVSTTLGATYQLTDKTILRTYGAQGYGLPSPANQRQALMKVSTAQVGVETAEIDFLWLKATYFYNRLRDIEAAQSVETLTNQNRQGIELELRTVPLFGLSLTGGYTYTEAKDADTGARLQSNRDQSVPPHLLKLALNYDYVALGLRGALTGNYVDWNAEAGTFGKNGPLIWDLHLTWKIMPQVELSPELFFSGRNLFSGVQSTNTELFSNAPRWFEGGLRFKF